MIQTFDDFLIIPSYSDIENDDVEIDITSDFFDFSLSVPILSSPMDTISGNEMLDAMWKFGGLGVHHRYCEPFELITTAGMYNGGIAVAPRMGIDFIKELLDCDPVLIAVLDVAHGDTRRNLDFCEEMVELGVNVVSGNIVTWEAAQRYYDIGVNYMRVGIGAGSVCTTRQVTGIGYPQVSAITSIHNWLLEKKDVKVISDGGHRNTGDIIKALYCGADFVMLGGMLAGTEEAAGTVRPLHGPTAYNYRGMASADALSTRKKEFFVEGISKEVTPKGSVEDVMRNIRQAIEQAFYYTGSRNLREFRESDSIELFAGAKVESYVR